MIPKELKEKYATGEWICVTHDKESTRWYISKMPAFGCNNREYKLIHKKHSEVLDHVLNDGKVYLLTFGKTRIWQHDENFFRNYHEDNTYEIIKDKPSLNGHYCLATKEHYDKLIEDGYEFNKATYLDYVYLDENEVAQCTIEYAKELNFTPMHLHNNEWVEGSLEHEYYDEAMERANKHQLMMEELKPKPVERITREEAHRKRRNANNSISLDSSHLFKEINELFDYIEYLEKVNQKEDK